MAIIYRPESTPIFQNQEVVDLSRFIEQELTKISQTLSNLEVESLRFTILNTAIGKPRNGDVAYADGTNWNPGTGAGLYQYVGGAWSKL